MSQLFKILSLLRDFYLGGLIVIPVGSFCYGFISKYTNSQNLFAKGLVEDSVNEGVAIAQKFYPHALLSPLVIVSVPIWAVRRIRIERK